MKMAVIHEKEEEHPTERGLEALYQVNSKHPASLSQPMTTCIPILQVMKLRVERGINQNQSSQLIGYRDRPLQSLNSHCFLYGV